MNRFGWIGMAVMAVLWMPLAALGGCCGAVRPMVSKRVGEIYSEGRARAIIRQVKAAIDPPSWDDRGGPGHIEVRNSQMIVSQTPENHEKIATLLSTLDDEDMFRVLVEARVLVVPTAQADAFRRWADGKDYSLPALRAAAPAVREHLLESRCFPCGNPILVVSLDAPGGKSPARATRVAAILSKPSADRRFLKMAIDTSESPPTTLPAGPVSLPSAKFYTIPDGGTLLVPAERPAQAAGAAVWLLVRERLLIWPEIAEISFPPPGVDVVIVEPGPPPPPPQLARCTCGPNCPLASWVLAPEHPPKAK